MALINPKWQLDNIKGEYFTKLKHEITRQNLAMRKFVVVLQARDGGSVDEEVEAHYFDLENDHLCFYKDRIGTVKMYNRSVWKSVEQIKSEE